MKPESLSPEKLKLFQDFQIAEGWTGFAINLGLRLAGALLTLYIGMHLARWIVRITARALTRAQVEPTAMQFLSRLSYVLLLVIVVLAILQIFFGVQPTSLFAVLGAAGLAIGLALKDSLSNVASGVMLVTLKPFRVGDVVDIGGKSGKVESVSIFQTRLRGADNQTIVVPNSLITAAPIVNLTPDTMRRIELVVGIGYNDDIDAARAAVMEIMHADPRILPEPPADVVVYELADSAVKLGIRCHVANVDHFQTRCDLNERIKKAFDRVGISIPYPQRDVHMYHHVAAEAAENGVNLSMQPQPQPPPQPR